MLIFFKYNFICWSYNWGHHFRSWQENRALTDITSDKNFFLGISRFKNKDAPLGRCHWWFNVYTGFGNPWENILYHGDIHFCSHRPESEMANKKAAVLVKVLILFIVNYNFKHINFFIGDFRPRIQFSGMNIQTGENGIWEVWMDQAVQVIKETWWRSVKEPSVTEVS